MCRSLITTLLVAVAFFLGPSPSTAQASVCLVDQDGDGLCDLWELTCLASGGQRSDLLAADSDGDHIRDDIEVGSYGAPAEALDTDGDCIIDACDLDTDGDGYSDQRESGCAFLCTDPADTDGDGVYDFRDDDSDNDGLPDRDERDADTDGDGNDDRTDPDSDNDGVRDGDDPDPTDPTVPGSGGDGGDGDGDGDDGGGGGGGSGSDSGGGDGLDEGSASLFAAGGGCNATNGSSGSSWLVFGIVVLALGFSRRARPALVVVVSMGVISEPRAEGFDNDITRTTVLGEGGVVVGNSDTLRPGHVRISALADYSRRPFELRDENDERVSGVIDGVTSIDLRIGVGLPRGFELSFLAPLVVDQQTTMGIAGRSLGDIGVAAKWSKRVGRRIGFAIAPELILPTGRSDALASDGNVGGQLQGLADIELGRLRVGGMAGARLRADSGTSFGATHGQQVLWGAVVDVAVAREHGVHLIGEVHGAAAASSAASENPAELLAAVHWLRDGWIVVAGGGAGLNSSVGAPAWRAFVGGAVTVGSRATPRRPPPARIASIAAPPPPPATPTEPAPPPVDPDPDRDGILGDADRCPESAEVVNDHEDDDGCPDEKPAYVLTAGASLVLHDIHFETGKWKILPVSYRILDDLAASLATQTDVRLRVEGHTDSRGSTTANLILSQQRALAIVNYLVGAGVVATRLEYEGFGESRPIASNANAEGMRANRRVELRVLAGAADTERRAW